MTATVIVNIVLAIFIVAAVLSLLGWGIATDTRLAASRSRRTRAERRTTPQATGARLGRVLDHTA